MKTNKKWDLRFMDVASLAASWSKDTTKVGASIVDKDGIVVSMGYNGLPRGCDDSIKERWVNPAKKFYAEHAEKNAIYHATRHGKPVVGCTLYSTLFPCADCAKAIIQNGIQVIVTTAPDFDNSSWGDSYRAAVTMLREAKVKIRYLEKK